MPALVDSDPDERPDGPGGPGGSGGPADGKSKSSGRGPARGDDNKQNAGPARGHDQRTAREDDSEPDQGPAGGHDQGPSEGDDGGKHIPPTDDIDDLDILTTMLFKTAPTTSVNDPLMFSIVLKSERPTRPLKMTAEKM